MMEGKKVNVTDTVEKLLARIEAYQKEKSHDVELASEIFDKLDRLVQTMSRLEAQRGAESKLVEKVEMMTKHVDKIMQTQEKREKQIEFEETVRKVLHGAKITGKVIETVAGSADVMFDTIARLLKEDHKGGSLKEKSSGEDFDIAALLKPLNSLIQGFASVGNSANKKDSGYSADSKTTTGISSNQAAESSK